MENLTTSESAPGQQQRHQHQQHQPMPRGPHPAAPPMMMPPVAPQLPPQMFTTAAQLLDLSDKKLAVVLRDGRKLIGVLRSWDQFANIVLQSTIERIYAPFPEPAKRNDIDDDHGAAAAPNTTPRGLYADVPRGLFLVRGENVLLLGEIDLDKDDDPPPGYERGDTEVVKRMAAERKDAEKIKDKARLRGLAVFGFEGENLGEIIL